MKISAAVMVAFLCLSSAYGATISTFTGGDVGDGLDLDGTFTYAVNVANNANNAPAGPDFTVRDATFKDDYHGGQLITGATAFYNLHNNWANIPTYGATSNDNNLEQIVWDIATPITGGASAGRHSLEMDVTDGQTYKLQAILNENHYATNNSNNTREQDLVLYDGAYIDQLGTGRTIFDTASNVNVVNIVGSSNTLTTGVVVTMEFTALASGTVTLASNSPASPTGGLDVIPILGAVTLEAIPEPSSVAFLGLLGLGLILRRRR